MDHSGEPISATINERFENAIKGIYAINASQLSPASESSSNFFAINSKALSLRINSAWILPCFLTLCAAAKALALTRASIL